ncbi:alpha/beta hydrolase [Patescibacteria group bacterium]
MKSKKVNVRNRNGLLLACIVEIPKGVDKVPFVIQLHGFKGYKNEETYTTLAKEFVKVGIGSIRFDASGFAESEGTLEKDYRFGGYVEDVEDVYDWLVSQSFVDTKRIGIVGQSMGGMQAIVFTSKHPEIRALCVISSPDKMASTDLLSHELAGWKERGYLDLDSSRYSHKIRVPYEFIKEAMMWDMGDFLPNIYCQSLYLWGSKDVTVQPDQTKRLFKLANDPKKLIEVNGMNHFYKRNPEILKKVNKIVTSFFLSKLQ